MRINVGKAVLASFICATVSSAGAETRARLSEKLARYERYAGASVEDVRNYRLYRWQPLGELELAIWANPGDVYLVKLDPPCNGLDFAKTIATTGTSRTLSARFDAVAFDRQRCTIRSIQPIDYKAMLADGDDAQADEASR